MNQKAKTAAQTAAEFIQKKLHSCAGEKIVDQPIGLVLGTGWGDALECDIKLEIPFSEIPGFEQLGQLEGHKRKLIIGEFARRQVLILSGRVHLNEAPADSDIYKMVRLQVEMLFCLGVKQIIITSASGSLKSKPHQNLRVGEVAVIDGFVSLFAPDMPLWAGEFCAPEDTLSERLIDIALEVGERALVVKKVGYAMVRGPQFEGRNYDKALLAASGAGVVGMSTLPEACIASLYGVEVLGLSFVTNSHLEEHSHDENLARAKRFSAHLGRYLHDIIAAI